MRLVKFLATACLIASPAFAQGTSGQPVVQGPASATSGDLTSFNGTGGKILQDSGVAAANVVQGPGSVTSGHIATFNGTGGKLIQDGGAVPTSSPCSAFGTTAGTCLQGAGALGTPSSGTATNLTGLPISTGVSGLGTGVAAALAVTASTTGGFPAFATGSWTPTDQSGASLSLTVAYATFIQVGTLVCTFAQITYPSTASGSVAIIGGLPQTAGHYGTGALNTTASVASVVRANTGATTLQPLTNSGGTVTNAQLTGAPLVFTLCYST